MVKLTECKQRKTVKHNGTKGYRNMSEERLLSTYDTINWITENFSRNGLNKIVKIQNLSLNELKKIERMNNLLLNALKQMAIARHIQNYKDMSKEDLLIVLLKSDQSYTELLKIDNSNTEIGETKKLFNDLRNNFLREEIKKCREKIHKKDQVCNNLKETEQKNSLMAKEKRVLKISSSILKS